MLDVAVTISSVLLGFTFAWASAAKAVRPRRWRDALERYRLGRAVHPVALLGVPVAEAAVVALIFAGRTRAAAALVLALISAFSLGVLRARSLGGDSLPCGCFGRASTRDYREMLVRNASLGALAAILLLSDGDARSSAPAPGDALPALLTAVGVLLLAWVTRQVGLVFRRRP
jgi:hypothetical protein